MSKPPAKRTSHVDSGAFERWYILLANDGYHEPALYAAGIGVSAAVFTLGAGAGSTGAATIQAGVIGWIGVCGIATCLILFIVSLYRINHKKIAPTHDQSSTLAAHERTPDPPVESEKPEVA